MTTSVSTGPVAGTGPSLRTDPTLLAVLARLQAALVLLSAGGEVAVMGSPVYAVVPIAVAVVLLRCAAIVTGRSAPGVPVRLRRTLRALVAVEVAALAVVPLSLLASLTPWVSWTPTLTGLATSVLLPLAMLLLARSAQARETR